MDLSFDAILEKAGKDNKIQVPHGSPKEKIEHVRKYFKKNKDIQEILPLYIFFRRVPGLPKSREGEFRKNVNLKVQDNKNVVDINLEMLKEYSLKLEKFISAIRQELAIKK